jgi:hypothetical protein
VNRDGNTMGRFNNIRQTISAKKNKIFWFLDDKICELKTSDPISGKIFTELDFNTFVSWEIWTYKPVKTNVFLEKN